MTRRPPRGREGGFALLLVLGTLPVVSMMVGAALVAGRSEVQIAGNVRQQAVETSIAEGAVYEAILRVADGEWPADGATHVVRVAQQALTVSVTSEDGKIDPSLAPLPLLRGLFLALGLDAGRAATLAARIVDYRSPGDAPSPHGAKTAQYRAAGKQYGPTGLPFRRVDELRLVLGIDDAVFALLRPHVSVDSGSGIDLANADPVVRQAYALAGPNAGYPQYRDPDADPLVVRIAARFVRADGSSAERAATVQFPNDDPTYAPPYRLLSWDDP